MFRGMRRFKQELSQEEARKILTTGSSGVLACAGDDSYPYAVPLSYAFDGERIYIHCAMEGHKIDAIRRNDKVSFCVIEQDQVMPGKFTTYFRSVVAFGRARLMEDEAEKRAALMRIGLKYEPGRDAAAREEIDGAIRRTALIEIQVEHLTGKEARELAAQRGKS